jgi:hypothetical protein
MAIGRISGPMLRANLERQGVDLSIETDLLYVDVNNNRIGINKAVPIVEFDLSGQAIFNNNLKIDGTTISSLNANGNISLEFDGSGTLNISSLTPGRVIFVGTNGSVVDSENLTFDGNNLYIGGDSVLNSAQLGNISITDNTISSTDTNGNIVLNPNGAGTVNIDTLTEGRVVFVGINGALVDSENLTFDGNNLYIGGNSVLNSAQLGNISITDNTISSTDTNDNIILDPNGIGNVVIDNATPNRVFFSGPSKELLTNNSLTYNGSTFAIDNISFSSNTISSTNSNGNVNINLNGAGQLVISGTNALTIPSGTTIQRPAGSVGDIRVNSATGNFEWYDGNSWQTITPITSVSAFDTFSGDGSTTQFTLSESSTTAGTIITLNGVVQSPGNAYSISGTTLTFTEAPKINDDIEVRYTSTTYSVGAEISDFDTSITVSDTNATIISKINNSNVIVTTATQTEFYGNVLPSAHATYDLGSVSVRWNNLYTTDLHLSNENKPQGNDVDGTTGNWTLQEGNENLYVINNITGKKYKISLIEV